MSGRSGDRTGETAKKLADLDRRIADARDAGKPKRRGDSEKYSAMSFAWRVTVELVVSIMIGAAMGWGLDSLFGTLPVFLVVFCLLGFASGVRTMMRSVAENQRRDAAKAARDEIES